MVQEGEIVATAEPMKTEMEIHASIKRVVKYMLAKPGDNIVTYVAILKI